jgi:dihydrofolate reductase
MVKLIYSAITSLDGYVADRDGRFDWAAPDEEVHSFVNELERPIGTYLYGRRMHDVMVAWEHMGRNPAEELPAPVADYARIWQAADKVVYSTSLAPAAVTTARTRLERVFDPAAVEQLKVQASRDIGIGGPGLAGHALRSGLVDEVNLFVNPVVVGGGTASLPADLRLALELLDERRFANGVVHLRYGTRAHR